MNMRVPSRSLLATSVYILALGTLPCMGCNEGLPPTSGSPATEGTDGSTESSTTSLASTTGDDTTTGSSTTEAAGTTDDGSEPYPEECYEPEALIEVTSAVTPSGPMTIDEAWLGGDTCTGHPYIVLVQYPSSEGPGIEVTLLIQPERPVDGPYLGIYPLGLPWEPSPVGTIDVLEPFEGLELEGANPDRHLHGLVELHGEGWDLSLEVDLIDCSVWNCFCSCR